MSRRRLTLMVAGVLTLMLGGVGALLPVPYVALSPGPTENTLGDVKGKPVITISGHQTYPTSGKLSLVTVAYQGGPERPNRPAHRAARLDGPDGGGRARGDDLPQGRLGQGGRAAEHPGDDRLPGGRDRGGADRAEDPLHGRPWPWPPRRRASRPTASCCAATRSPRWTACPVRTARGRAPRSQAQAGRAGDLRHRARRPEPDGRRSAPSRPRTAPPWSASACRHAYKFPFKVNINVGDVGGPSAGLMFSLGI